MVGGASAEHKETGELVHWFDPEEGTVWSLKTVLIFHLIFTTTPTKKSKCLDTNHSTP